MDQLTSFPFLLELEENWEDILWELENLLYNETVSNISLFESHDETEIDNGGWYRFPLFVKGKSLQKSYELCPRTTGLLDEVPGVVSASFVSLEKESCVMPHKESLPGLLRCHLGLVVPSPLSDYDRRSSGTLVAQTCGMRIENEIHYWTPGGAFVLSDLKEWEAWNWGDRTCFVLEIDFKKPFARVSPGKEFHRFSLADILALGKSTKV